MEVLKVKQWNNMAEHKVRRISSCEIEIMDDLKSIRTSYLVGMYIMYLEKKIRDTGFKIRTVPQVNVIRVFFKFHF